jgi:hypothetical protein
MFRSYANDSFWGCYDSLPDEVRREADKQFALFEMNPGHPSLRLKPIGELWSARVTRSYRALARRRGDAFYWFWIGTHSDYEKLLGR